MGMQMLRNNKAYNNMTGLNNYNNKKFKINKSLININKIIFSIHFFVSACTELPKTQQQQNQRKERLLIGE